MAKQKKQLQEAAAKFRKENQGLYGAYSTLLSKMAGYIIGSGALEVTTGFKNGRFYAYENR